LPFPALHQRLARIFRVAISLNHFSIRSTDLPACERFYGEALGLTVGPRPPFPFPGLWMYAGDTAVTSNAVVHIIGIDAKDPEGLKQYLGDRQETSLSGSGAVDHIAFFNTGLAEMQARFSRLGILVRERTVPSLGLHQLFLDDPNGVVIELNFPAHEKPA
jgi:catechol 2,3-dioxygenase-like lactoylglutathione lyase family enzyme